MKLDTFSINVQRYLQNHKIAFLGHPMGHQRQYNESFNAKKHCSRVSSRECQFYSQNSELAILSHSFWGGGLRGNRCDSSVASWKARYRLPVSYNCTFSLAITAEALRRNRPLFKRWITLGLNVRLKGFVYRQHLYIVR